MEPFPRKGSIVYNIRFGDEKSRKRTLDRWKLMNRFVIVPLARMRLLPLLFLKNIFIAISVLGRKTGKRRYIGISLRKLDEELFVFLALGKRTQWYKNHLANPDQTFVYYGFRKYPARLVLLGSQEKDHVMTTYVKKHPKWARLGIGWKQKDDDPNGELLRDYVSTIEIARITLLDK